MSVPTSEVGYTIATTRSEPRKFIRTCGGIGEGEKTLICKIWRDEKMPDDWKRGLIVPLFKKGEKNEL
jgi:hypothetical protein